MSRSVYISYNRGQKKGFWAYYLPVMILLEHMVELAEKRIERDNTDWLTEPVEWWNIFNEGTRDFGVYLDSDWSPEELEVVLQLIDEACQILSQKEYIPEDDMPTSRVIELGRSIQDLLKGTWKAPSEEKEEEEEEEEEEVIPKRTSKTSQFCSFFNSYRSSILFVLYLLGIFLFYFFQP